MFNFYVVLAGHDKVNDANMAAKSKAHQYKPKVEKTKDIPKTWVFTGKQFEDFRRKKNTSSLDQTTPWNVRPLYILIEYATCKQ